MGYKILYEKLCGIQLKHEEKKRILKLRNVVISIWLFVAGLGIWQNRAWVLDCLVPGDNTITVAAFEDLVENVRSGTDLGESVTAFCKEILDHGQISG